jgi:hypothetical protein
MDKRYLDEDEAEEIKKREKDLDLAWYDNEENDAVFHINGQNSGNDLFDSYVQQEIEE